MYSSVSRAARGAAVASHINFTGRFDPSTLTTGFLQKCDQLDGRQPVLCERNDWLVGKAATVLVGSRLIRGGGVVEVEMLLLPGNALAAGSEENGAKSPCNNALMK